MGVSVGVPLDPVELRPLRPPEIVDAAIVLCRAHAVEFVALTGTAIVPTAGVAAVVLAVMGGWEADAVAGGVALCGLLFAVSGSVHMAGQLLLGRPIAWRGSIAVAARRSGGLAVVSVVTLLRTVLGLLFFLVGAAWVVSGSVLALPSLLLEPANPWVAMRRSRALALDRRTALLYALAIAAGLVVVSGGVVAAALQWLLLRPTVVSDATRASAVVIAVAATAVVGLPVIGATLVLLYTDARVRTEGLDIQFLLDATLRDVSA